jgi:uncharacterized protein (DUF58 family)
VQPTAVALAAAALLFVLHQFLLRAGGRAWPAPIAALAVVAFAIDLVVAVLDARRPVVSLSLGADATVGRPVAAVVDVRQPAARRALLAITSVASPRAELDVPGVAQLDVVPGVRGVLREVALDVSFEGPLGLAHAVRTLVVPLAAPLHVGPAPLELPDVAVPPGSAADDGRGRPDPQGDLTRSVRDLRPGDPLRHVHWPATARQGRLMTRELERPAAEAASVLVDLGPLEGADAERAASYAAHALAVLLERGVGIELTTREPGGVRHGQVASRREAGRRLAAASAGPPLPDDARPAVRIGPTGWRPAPVVDGG